MIDPVHDIQQSYRKVLRAFSFPGEVLELTGSELEIGLEFHSIPGLLNLSIMLFDNRTNCFFHNIHEEDVAIIRQFTNTNLRSIEEADFIVINGLDDEALELLQRIKNGNHIDPHLGSTVILICDSVEEFSRQFFQLEQQKQLLWTVEGPGIKKAFSIAAGQNNSFYKTFIEVRNEKCAEFPLGVEIILLDQSNRFCAYPRSSLFTDVREVS